MALELPIYVIVGKRPVSAELVKGRLRMRGWDFETGKMTRDAANWEDIVGHLEPGQAVKGNVDFAKDTRRVTKKEFMAAVAELAEAAASAAG